MHNEVWICQRRNSIKISGWAMIVGPVLFLIGGWANNRPPYVSYAMSSLPIDRYAVPAATPLIVIGLVFMSLGIFGMLLRYYAKVRWVGHFVRNWCACRVSQCSWGYSLVSERQQPMVGFVSPRHGGPIYSPGYFWLDEPAPAVVAPLERAAGTGALVSSSNASIAGTYSLGNHAPDICCLVGPDLRDVRWFRLPAEIRLCPKRHGCGCLNQNWIKRHVLNSAWRSLYKA